MTAAHRIGTQLTRMLGWPDAPWERVDVIESPTALASTVPLADMASAVQGLVGLSASELHRARGGAAQQVGVDRWEASLSVTPSTYLLVDGKPAVEWDPLTGYYETTDGWVYLHTGMPNLRERLLAAFRLPPNKQVVAAAMAALSGQEIEDRAAAAGCCAILRRSRAEWEAHPHAAHLGDVPVVALTRSAEAPQRVRARGQSPLDGVRVLDLSRVIAGPTVGRTLAEHGADVLRIAGPGLPFISSLVISTGFGKRSAFVDLTDAAGCETLAALIREADVLIDGYRPGALAGKGFAPADLFKLNPGLVIVTLSAFGADGPWGGRRGFDTYIQAATGLTTNGPEGPVRLPCQPLDYLSGYLGAAAAMVALGRQMTEGGGWIAELSLARTAMWLWEQSDRLPPEAAPPARNPAQEDVAAVMLEMASDFGRLTAMRPSVRLPETPARFRHAPHRLGVDPAAWLD